MHLFRYLILLLYFITASYHTFLTRKDNIYSCYHTQQPKNTPQLLNKIFISQVFHNRYLIGLSHNPNPQNKPSRITLLLEDNCFGYLDFFHHKHREMEEAQSSQVVDLVNKFQQATLDLGDVSEVAVVKHNNKEDEDKDDWKSSAIGKIIIEGRMSYDMVEKGITFTWPFITLENLKIIEVKPNVMIFKFNQWELLNKVIEERPWSINKHLPVVHDYIPGMVYTEKHWGFQLFWIQLKYLLPEHMNVTSVTKNCQVQGGK